MSIGKGHRQGCVTETQPRALEEPKIGPGKEAGFLIRNLVGCKQLELFQVGKVLSGFFKIYACNTNGGERGEGLGETGQFQPSSFHPAGLGEAK